MMTKKHILLAGVMWLVCVSSVLAQKNMVWHNPLKAKGDVVQNRGLKADGTFDRIPLADRKQLRKAVQEQCRQSAGIALSFYSNAPSITVRYTTTGKNRSMVHMPATGVSGIDLYGRDCYGEWHRLTGKYSLGDTVAYRFENIPDDKHHKRGFEFRLFFPLYNGVKWMEIGIPQGSDLEWIPAQTERPVVVYGTSIAQGACASRPGMAWTNILHRRLDKPVVNLGFSGNGQLEPEVLSIMQKMDAAAYVIDCMPNLDERDSAEVARLTTAAVHQLRQTAPHTPILLVEHSGFDGISLNPTRYEQVRRTNAAQRSAYEQLTAQGTGHLYYITREELGIEDQRVDYVHLNDLAMNQQAAVIEKALKNILDMPEGTLPTQKPVTQRRDASTYEWLQRHRDICQYVKEKQPKAVLIGNSICHYWGGESGHPVHRRGQQAWEKYMAPRGFANLGCGWDRVENVLWRVEHGELEGYSPDYVVMKIGTNNFGLNTPEETVEGIRLVVKAIRARQPQAHIILLGLLPRRNGEAWINQVNGLLRPMAQAEGCIWANPGANMLTPEGKTNEQLFSDGLHPNKEGYEILSRGICEAMEGE